MFQSTKSLLCSAIIRKNLKGMCSDITRNYLTLSAPHQTNCLEIHKTDHLTCRFKSKSKKLGPQEDSESDEKDDKFDEEIVDKYTKIMNVKLNSMRTDVVLKAGLGLARNKIETLFYESKIRVNGQKILKKSELVDVGDEIDIVKGKNTDNPKFLTIARVEVLSADAKDEAFKVRLRRCKTLTVENYADPWSG